MKFNCWRCLQTFTFIFVFMSSTFAQVTGLNVEKTRPEDRLDYPKEFSLYKQAMEKSLELPKMSEGYKSLSMEILGSGWIENKEIINLLAEWQEVISLFKQATAQENYGEMFGKRPEKITITTEIPHFPNAIPILKLILLQAKMYEAKGEYARAKENYIAALRFPIHLSQQEFKPLLIELIEMVCLTITSKSLQSSLQSNIHNRNYHDHYRKILLVLNSIIENQDFMESSLREEANFLRSISTMLENSARSEASKRESANKKFTKSDFFDIFELGPKKDIMEDDSNKDRLMTMEAIDEFFTEFNKHYNETIEELYINGFIAAAKQNKPEIFDEKAKKYQDDLEKFRKRIKSFPFGFGYGFVERLKGRNLNQIQAEIFAKTLLVIAFPKYGDAIEAYHEVYNVLQVTTTALAIKLYNLDNGNYPESLNELVPDYLAEIPQDTYNDFKPLEYRHQNDSFTVYSIGPDKKDDFGLVDFILLREKEDNPSDKGDIVFSTK